MEKILRLARKIIPKKIFKVLQPVYHWLWAFLAAVIYRFPSRKIFVVAVTGTKGKTSTIEIISAILEEAGFKTALTSSLRFKIGEEAWKNEYKMTMPGRFFLQKFLRRAVREKCQYAVLEFTSEGAVQHRNKFIKTNALVFTNLAPEHIESHGSFGAYRDAKLRYCRDLENSREKIRIAVINEDDAAGPYFLKFNIPQKIKYGLKDVSKYELQKDGLTFVFDKMTINSKLSGLFNLYNILAAVAFCKTQNIGNETMKKAIEKFQGIEGRLEKIDEGQNFTVVVDYAHTPDSLEKIYETFQASRKICVLGSAGGGRDKWKRPEMGKIASKHCDQIILTNEDPYDENPQAIMEEVKSGISNKRTETIEDRREAIAQALRFAQTGDTVVITGKGAEPWLMGPKGTKIKWDDREVVREELLKILKK
jgi:UDP-N-acetylmuramoyl-L-alanyl-D-glutamate--2,6-diaminopimelate ligase